MCHSGTTLMRPGDILKSRLMLPDNSMGKMQCSSIFGKYIAVGDLQSHQAVIRSEAENSP